MKHSSHNESQTGFTLIEILVAMLIATTLMLAVVRIFSRVGETYELNAESLQLMETTRVALRFIKNDLIQAGYMGCMHADDNESLFRNIEPMINDVQTNAYGVWGDDGVSKPDNLTLFYTQDLDIRVLATDTKGRFFPNPSLIVDSVNLYDAKGDLVVDEGDWLSVNNCAHAAAFILTNSPAQTNAASMGIVDPGTTATGNVSALEFARGLDYDGYRNVHMGPMESLGGFGFLATRGGAGNVGKYFHIKYEVADSEIDGGATQSLFRLVNGEPRSKTNEVVRMVEDFQVEYGVDDQGGPNGEGDGVVDFYVDELDVNEQKPVMLKVKVVINDGTRSQELLNIVKLRNKGL